MIQINVFFCKFSMKYSFLGSLTVNCGNGNRAPTCGECEISESGCGGDCEFSDGYFIDSCIRKEAGKRDLIT